jgi:opacity protein-like surface antigen
MKRVLVTAVLLAALAASAVQAEPPVFKDKKYFGPIAHNGLSFGVGFLDGADFDYLFEHLDAWARARNGFDNWELIPISPYAHARYERQLTPNHYFKSVASLSYISSSSLGQYVAQFPDTLLLLDIERDFAVYLFAVDVGFSYCFITPAPQRFSPYTGAGFSAVVPMVRLDTRSFDNGKPFSNPAESISQNSFQAGLHFEFGMNYFISNRYALGLEGKYQMSQSKFDIHGGNFDLKYAGFMLTLNLTYFL